MHRDMFKIQDGVAIVEKLNSNALPTELRGKVCSSVWYISELSLVFPLIQMY